MRKFCYKESIKLLKIASNFVLIDLKLPDLIGKVFQ